jgi:hypothetical protein
MYGYKIFLRNGFQEVACSRSGPWGHVAVCFSMTKFRLQNIMGWDPNPLAPEWAADKMHTVNVVSTICDHLSNRPSHFPLHQSMQLEVLGRRNFFSLKRLKETYLGTETHFAFSGFLKAICKKRLLVSSCHSVCLSLSLSLSLCLHGTTMFAPDGFSLNFTSVCFYNVFSALRTLC